VICGLCIALVVFGLLADEPSPDRLARRRIKQWNRERLDLNPALRRRS
jgi:hypothetical protein